MSTFNQIDESLSYFYHRSSVKNLRLVKVLGEELRPQAAQLDKTARAGVDVVVTTTPQKLSIFDAVFSQNTELSPDAVLAEIAIANSDGLNVQFDTSLNFYSTVSGTFLLEYFDDGVTTGITDSVTFGAGYNNVNFGARLSVPDATKIQIYLGTHRDARPGC